MNKGITNAEALEIQEREGLNKLQKKKKKSLFIFFLQQFKDLMVILLLIATLFSYSLAIYTGVKDNWNYSTQLLIAFIEPSIILIVVVINAIVGTVQESKSQQAVEALAKLNPLKVKVYRDGVIQNIDAEQLVKGDHVILEAGDIVPADGNLVLSANLKVIETSLTGESESVLKNANDQIDPNLPIAEQSYRVFSSTLVAAGSAEFIVDATGMNTQIGTISKMLNDEEEKMTPLQLKINKLGKIFGWAGLALFMATLIMQVIFQAINKENFANVLIWGSNIMNAISLAVAAIPEGLVTFTTIILALSVQQMTKRNAIVKSLMAVETLGSTSVICSDKTGTLTQNKMTIVRHLTNETTFEKVLLYSSLASDAHINTSDSGEIHYVGDPTEIAIIQKAIDFNVFSAKQEADSKYKRIHLFPFDSDRKLMSSVNIIDGEYYLITKGAPENVNKISIKSIENILNTVENWANNALRTLAIGIRKLTKSEVTNLVKLQPEDVEKNLHMIGLIGMIDPPRDSSKESIKLCKDAGIRTIMITGDNVITAKAIAKELGIYHDGDYAIEGIELDAMNDEELSSKIDHCSVFARVAPKDKIRIVKILQSKDNVVAMTGDGVNDAPALKAADIGCAMGIAGTEVSKEAANMILIDDNFSTIVKSVEKGRSVYETIRIVIKNLLITSVAEIIFVFFGLFIFSILFKDQIKLINAPGNEQYEFYILSATQLLWINLFTHGFPAIALGLQNNGENYMKRKPTSKNESIFARRMGIDVLWQGTLIGILCLISYYLGAQHAINMGKPEQLSIYGSSTSFLILGLAAIISSLNLMSTKPIFMSNPLKHKLVYGSVIFSTLFMFLVSAVPSIAAVFRLSETFYSDWRLVAIAFGFLGIIYVVFEFYKILNIFINKYTKLKY